MGRVFVPENFDETSAPAQTAAQGVAHGSETERLGVFERGYKAGWDDAATAMSDERRAISADFAASLSDLSFTYHEARGHVLRQLEDLVIETFSRILPDCAKTTLPHVVWEQIGHVAAESAGAPMTVLVAPGASGLLDELLPADPGLPISVVEEPTLTEGQVFIRSPKVEVAVDHASALEDIDTAVRQFFMTQAQDDEALKSHG